MLFTTSFVALLAFLGGLAGTANAARDWNSKCAGYELACILTGPGVTVSGPAIRHGVMPGTGLTAWEIENNKFVKGTVSGCGGTATWAFQPGDSFFDSSKQGKGRLYAWYRTQTNNKVLTGTAGSRAVGDDLYAPPSPESTSDLTLDE